MNKITIIGSGFSAAISKLVFSEYNPIIINTDYPKLINFVKILYTVMLIKFGLQAKNGK